MCREIQILCSAFHFDSRNRSSIKALVEDSNGKVQVEDKTRKILINSSPRENHLAPLLSEIT
jgi:hypothetical protein